MEYSAALRIAESIKAQLAPWCDRIEIAGSLRRKRPEVGDIDLVLLPKPGTEFRQAILDRVKKRCTIQTGDSITASNTICILPTADPLQLDLFFRRPASEGLPEISRGRKPGIAP